MRDLPIIMSSQMVLATRREIEKPGTGKTMTRRLAATKPAPAPYVPGRWARVKPGDRLWVRENFWQRGRWAIKPGGGLRYTFQPSSISNIVFAADGDARALEKGKFAQSEPAWHLRPNIFLPRERSRITLIVTATKVERLQEISEAECIAEGCEVVTLDGNPVDNGPMVRLDDHVYGTPRTWFREIWDSLHGAGAWDANPEVVAITFRPVLENIDNVKEAA